MSCNRWQSDVCKICHHLQSVPGLDLTYTIAKVQCKCAKQKLNRSRFKALFKERGSIQIRNPSPFFFDIMTRLLTQSVGSLTASNTPVLTRRSRRFFNWGFSANGIVRGCTIVDFAGVSTFRWTIPEIASRSPSKMLLSCHFICLVCRLIRHLCDRYIEFVCVDCY